MESQNNRDNFRLNVSLQCQFILQSINGQTINTGKTATGKILNVSAGGMLLETMLNFPSNMGIQFEFTFVLEGEIFNLKGGIVRKEESSPHYLYGIKFIQMPEKVESLLVSILARLQVTRVRAKKVNYENYTLL